MTDLGEVQTIRRMLARLDPPVHPLTLPVGGDCAVGPLPPGEWDVALASDPVIQGVHFEWGSPPAGVGHKALGRVLSDLAAVGAKPLWALVNIVARPDQSVAWLEAFYDGLNRLARRHQCDLIGGDLARGADFQAHVFGVGITPKATALTRASARPGDVLFVTGELGGSRQGRQFRFEPRVAEGQWLRAQAGHSAAIDLSDGLATDVRHVLAASGVGARLRIHDLPVAAAAAKCGDDRPPWVHALTDGEDFELLFGVRPAQAATLAAAWRQVFQTPLWAIGELTDQPGQLEIQTAPAARWEIVSFTGFDHYATHA
ncbi:MAG: thiamine-phosphate kinase [Candidatus Marinimicrobia bacterium]|nr:thiamine-phosphate kinase [Candidatus Neomarinimicrobiota bacterium]